MRRRLRKKKHLAEFKELGFEIRATLKPDLTDKELDALLGRLIELAQTRELACGGAIIDGELYQFIAREAGGNASEEDRAALTAFLGADTALVRHQVGDLRDAWYGWQLAGVIAPVEQPDSQD